MTGRIELGFVVDVVQFQIYRCYYIVLLRYIVPFCRNCRGTYIYLSRNYSFLHFLSIFAFILDLGLTMLLPLLYSGKEGGDTANRGYQFPLSFIGVSVFFPVQ